MARQKYAGIVVASDAMRCDAMRILSPGIFAVKRILSAISTLSSTALHYSAFLGNCQNKMAYFFITKNIDAGKIPATSAGMTRTTGSVPRTRVLGPSKGGDLPRHFFWNPLTNPKIIL